jgi:hypothetical protein
MGNLGIKKRRQQEDEQYSRGRVILLSSIPLPVTSTGI